MGKDLNKSGWHRKYYKKIRQILTNFLHSVCYSNNYKYGGVLNGKIK